jgi:hypothetical protein
VDYFSDTFPRHLIQGTREALTLENLIVFGLAGAATGALLTVDDEIVDYFRDERPMGQTAQDVGSTLGSPQMLFGLAGATYLVGEFSKNSRIRTTGETALESLALTGLTTILLKVSTQRERPDGSNNLSFPSLHAAGSFAVAASLHEGYGFRVSVPAFLTAGFISLARVQEQKHFLSDTLFGAALGTVIGLDRTGDGKGAPAELEPAHPGGSSCRGGSVGPADFAIERALSLTWRQKETGADP